MLESQIRQLDKALDTSRFHLQQTENVIRSRTPTGPELDSSYTGYVSIDNGESNCLFYMDDSEMSEWCAYIINDFHANQEKKKNSVPKSLFLK